MSGLIHKGAVPYEVDVKKIREAFPDSKLAVGTTIEYSDIEALIGVDYKSSRFKGVTKAWRDGLEKDYAMMTEANGREKFFRILDDNGKADVATIKHREMTARSERILVISQMIERKNLNEERRKKLDFHQLRAAAFVQQKLLRTNKPLLPDD